MENLLMEIQKSMHQRRSLSVLNNGGFGYNSFHYYSLNPSINSSIYQLLLNNPNTNMSSNLIRGSLPIISPPRFYSSSFPLDHHRHNQPPLLPFPIKSSTRPLTNKKPKKKKQQRQQQQQSKPNFSNITIPKSESKTEDAKPIAKKEEEDTEEEFLIIGSLLRPAVTSLYSISPPPPSSVPMPRLLLKPKINNVGSCNAEAMDSAGATDDLRRLLRL